MKTIRQLIDLFEGRERWQLLGLLFCVLVMALLEMAGVASILPFMQLVSNPDLVHRNHWLASVYSELGFSSIQQFLFFVGLAIVILIALTNGFSAFTYWLMHRFAWSQNHRLSMRLLGAYLNQPYAFFLNRNSASMTKNILSEVQVVVNHIMLSILRFTSRLLVAILIISLLAVVDFMLALMVSGVLGGSYGLIYVLLRRKQRQLGRDRVVANRRRFQVAGEAFAGIKELKVFGREQAFLGRFRKPSWQFSRTAAYNQIVAKLPHYALETIAFGGILLIVLYSLRMNGNVTQILPVLSLYAFAGYRLMPALNELFGAGVQIRFHLAALDDLHEDLREMTCSRGASAAGKGGKLLTADEPIHFEREIALRNVSLVYPEATVPALHKIDLSIHRYEVVGLVGETGAGKTTLVDVILGLLEPTSGTLELDGEPLMEERLDAWRRMFGYVPQTIFLSDDTIRANIAFGLPEKEIDQGAVEKATRVARIHDFIHTLPGSYDTVVGERGVRLSGGQRQRIGIARALYSDPEVLILDEATSSLDGATEAAVMEMIQHLEHTKTMIVIAHRLSTVQNCDVVHLMDAGSIVASASYEELLHTNDRFRAMAGLTPTT